MLKHRWLTLALLDASVLAGTAPAIPHAYRLALTRPTASVDALAATLCGATVEACALWLAVGLFAHLAGALPGLVGAAGRQVAARVLPGVVRRALAGVVGVGVAASPVACFAGTPGPAAARGASVPAPNWPSDGRLPAPRWPVSGPSTAARAPAQPAPRPLSGPAAPSVPRVVVRPGDTLWDIAARTLAGRPTAARVAASWPRWWAANRSVIGQDPDLIRPGEVLTAPPDPAKELR